jgi:hypothetical protein
VTVAKAALRTAHQSVGAWLLAAAAVAAVQTFRASGARPTPAGVPAEAPRFEPAAPSEAVRVPAAAHLTVPAPRQLEGTA